MTKPKTEPELKPTLKSPEEFARIHGLDTSLPAGFVPEYLKVLIEQFKLLVDSADKTSTRRQTANTLFVILNSGLVTFVGAQLLREDVPNSGKRFWIGAGAALVAGLMMCLAWAFQIKSYKLLNRVKFHIINNDFEPKMPAAFFSREWDHLQANGYQDLSAWEIWLPGAFALIHIALIALRAWA